MTYQVFARKWRPKSFTELVGQEPIKIALSYSLKTGRIHHAYLFCGTRGVGKTTLGRLLAKCLNCEKGVTPEPCGTCPSCTAIDQGRFLDLIEVDAASKTRVEDTRELLDNVQYAPTQGRYKIYLIDEVHMLSTHSFNALLKTLEEPPEHVKFILATTDPEKIPATILSRCLKFVLRPIPDNLIIEQLIKILEQENIAFEKTALPPIASAAQGSMRDALSLLEQAVLAGEGILGNKEVEQLLGWVAPEIIQKLLQAICNQDASLLQSSVADLVEIGADFSQALDRLLEAFYHISLMQASDLNIAPELKNFAEKLSQETTQLFYQIALVGKQELAFAPTQKIGFEMTLLRMLAFYPEATTIILGPEQTSVQSPKPTAVRPIAQLQATEQAQPQINWPNLVAQLPLTGFTKMLANNCELAQMSDTLIVLILDRAQQVCLTPERLKTLEESLSTYFKKAIKLKIELGAVRHTPMQLEAQQKQVHTEMAMKTVQMMP